ncbi:MAG: T9SS type A sorting domain-containing protein [Bacteroidia bacterium]|nr:T9SS type A sorting domain-containing protein [Bacteroidia bacterium]
MRNSVLICCSFLVLLLSHSEISAQTTWERLFSKRSTDSFRSVIEVPSGGYMISGYTADSTLNDTDAYAVRMTTAGDTLWTKRINGPNSRKDLLYKVINTNDGGFVFCGYSTNNGIGNDDAYWIKLDEDGVLQWSKYWGGAGKDRAQDIIQTSDGGFAIAGYTTSPPAAYYDAFLIRLNSSGDTLWSKRYGTSGFDDANSIIQLPDGGFVLGGQSTNGANGLDMYLVRAGSTGDLMWTKKLGTAGTDNIEQLIRRSDGSLILAGGTDGPGLGGNDGYLVKTDSGGSITWSQIYGGNSQDDFHEVHKTTDGGYLLSGTSRSSGALEPNMWLVKTNSSGDSLWTRTYGGDNHDHGYSAIQTADGGFIFVGYTSSFGFNSEEAYVVKTDGLGDIIDELTYVTVSTLIQPLDRSCVSSNVQVKVLIQNFGNTTVTGIPVSLQISGPVSQTLNQTFTGNVYPQDFDTLSFATLIDFGTPGVYTFNATSSVVNDVFPQNNTLVSSITIQPYALAPVVTDGARCGSGSVTIQASSTDSVFWYSASVGGNLLGAGPSYTSPVISTSTIYFAQAGMACPSARIPVNAIITSAPTAPVTTSAQRCGTGSVILSATATDQVRWFANAVGGTSLTTGYTFNTPSIANTTTYYAETFNNGCTSSRVATIATIIPQTASPVTSSASRCDPGTLILSATATDPVTWYDAAVGGNIIGTGPSFTTPVLSATTTYYAEASNGTCPSARIAAYATITSQVSDPIVNHGFNCGAGTVTLSATSNETLIWYASATGGTQLGAGSTFVTPFIASSTTYFVVATNGACPSNYVAVQANIHPPITVNIGPDTTVVSGSNYTLDPGAGFVQYLWSDGSTSQTLMANGTDNYCVTVTDANGCTATDCANVQISVGIEKPQEINSFSFYPNPSSSDLFLQFDEDISQVTCMLFSVDGKLVFEKEFKNLSSGIPVPINVNSLSTGIYIMRIKTKDWTATRRVIRE